MKLFAKVTIGGQEHDRVPVLNPGNCFGKTWLIEIGGCYSPLFLIVEADSITDAIDELADNDTYGHHVIVSEEDLKDYDLDDCYFDGCGRVLDLDHLAVHGQRILRSPIDVATTEVDCHLMASIHVSLMNSTWSRSGYWIVR